MISIYEIKTAMERDGIPTEELMQAIDHLENVLVELDSIQVSGRRKVENMLGCMMAIEQIIGEEADA